MGFFGSRKLLLVLVVTSYVFSGSVEAWSWSWGSRGSSGLNSGGSRFGWGWTSDEPDTDWHWRSSPASNHSNGTGSTHNHTTPSNHSTNHTAPSNHSSGAGSTSNNHNHTLPISFRRKIIEVTVWNNGFDYQEWASKNGPYYVYDILFFRYSNDQTQSKKPNNNTVYLFQDLKSYKRCDVTKGKKLEEARGGSSLGLMFFLRKAETYYFASGDHNDCNHNNMKFSLSPIPRPIS